MFRIGEFSKMSKTTIKTIRYYDEIGLLEPETTDRFTGYRMYTTNQLLRLHKIQSLRQVGLTIEEVRNILSGNDVENILRQRKAELIADLTENSEKLRRINFILQEQKEKEFMNYQATIKELRECIVYSKKLTVPNYDAYFHVLPAIAQEVKEKYPDLKCIVPEYCFIIYLDKEYKESDINIEYCEAVDGMRPDFNGIVFKKMDPMNALSVMHKGDYPDLGKAYAFAFKWIEENGYVIAADPRERYIDGIWNKESKEDWLTELQIPIKRK